MELIFSPVDESSKKFPKKEHKKKKKKKKHRHYKHRKTKHLLTTVSSGNSALLATENPELL